MLRNDGKRPGFEAEARQQQVRLVAGLLVERDEVVLAQAAKRESLRHQLFFFSSRRRHTRFDCDWSSDVCSSDLPCSCRVVPRLPADILACRVRWQRSEIRAPENPAARSASPRQNGAFLRPPRESASDRKSVV